MSSIFLEQCFNLLRQGGECGIVIPSDIYNGLSAKQLRETLFKLTNIRGLFGFENRKTIFEAVDSRFKFVVLTFEKGGQTQRFPAAFMRHDVGELDTFPEGAPIYLSVDFIYRLSPESLAIMEFKEEIDFVIAEKIVAFPPLGQKVGEVWEIKLMQELNMTGDSELFKPFPDQNLVPLVQGSTFHQFQHAFAQPKYWIDLQEGRAEVIGRDKDEGQKLAYQDYRFVHRRIARNTDTRSLIACVLPPDRFCADTAQAARNLLPGNITVFLTAILNSFVVDSELRQRITAHADMHFMYALHVPRLTERDPQFRPIVERAARLICTTPEFDALAQEVGLGDHTAGVTDAADRATLRAELDGMIAHLYGLTEAEFSHILATFPLVAQEVKDAALQAYRALVPNPDDQQLAALLAGGENARLELKVAAIWNAHKAAKDGEMRENIVRGVAAFMNSTEEGALVIGVANDGTIVGLADDYRAANAAKPNRDGYELWLANTIADRLGADLAPFYTISFHTLNGQDICRIRVLPASRPVYLDGDLYVRSNNGKKKLNAQDAYHYHMQRWP